MASTYSDLLRLEKQADGENDTTWGQKVNTVFEMIEDAIAGRAAITHSDAASYTLTTANSATDEARNMMLNIGGALTAGRNAVVPTSSKLYFAKNATTGGFAVTVKTSGGTGIAVPNGKSTVLICDGTNVVDAIDWLSGLTIGGTLTLPNTGLRLADTNASHYLTIAPGSDLTADRTLTVTTGDAARTITISATGTLAMLNVEDQALTGGVIVTSKDLGTAASGTVTPDPGDRPLQHYINGGAHALAPSANAGSVLVDITNDGSAGAITTSGFTFVAGDAFTTTNGHKFRCHISIGNAGSLLSVQALQ